MTQTIEDAKASVENAIASLTRQDVIWNLGGAFPDAGYGRLTHAPLPAPTVEIEFDAAAVLEAASLVLPERVAQLAGALDAYARANEDLATVNEAGPLQDNFAYFDKEMNFPDRDEHPDMPRFRKYQDALDLIDQGNAALNEVREALKG